jgi:hypothetical protein
VGSESVVLRCLLASQTCLSLLWTHRFCNCHRVWIKETASGSSQMVGGWGQPPAAVVCGGYVGCGLPRRPAIPNKNSSGPDHDKLPSDVDIGRFAELSGRLPEASLIQNLM